MYKTPNFDKLQSEKNHIFSNVNDFLGLNFENIALSKDFRIVRKIEIELSLFCSNQMKIQEIDHSDSFHNYFPSTTDQSKSELYNGTFNLQSKNDL